MALHLPRQGSVDRSVVLRPYEEQITGTARDGSTFVETRLVRHNGGLPADPAWFRKRADHGSLARWLRATSPVALRLAR
jgi:hypothetical protein